MVAIDHVVDVDGEGVDGLEPRLIAGREGERLVRPRVDQERPALDPETDKLALQGFGLWSLSMIWDKSWQAAIKNRILRMPSV